MDVLLDASPVKSYPRPGSATDTTELYLHQVQKQHRAGHAPSQLEHVSQLDIDHVSGFVRQATIVCTLGDRWNNDKSIESMIQGGMNILRLNMSMGSYEYYADVIRRVRAIEEASNYKPPVAIAIDISAPPIRTGIINNDVEACVTLKDGQFVKLTINNEFQNATSDELIYLDSQYFPCLVQCVSVGDRIHLDDGMLSLIVRDVTSTTISCLVEQGGQLGGGKRVDLPSERLYQKTFKTTYQRDLAFACESKVDYVFTEYSFTPHQISEARSILGDKIKLFAKVQSKESIRNLLDIISVSDGIIVGRNGLGLVYPAEKIFQLQKQIIAICNLMQKPVFVISQLLESMRFKPRATRAEISDVANAVIDGADGLILTVETSRGLFPKEAARVLHKTCREAESAIYHEKYSRDLKVSRDIHGLSPRSDPAYLTALAAVEASTTSRASAVFVATATGQSASTIAAFRPSCPVVAVVRDVQVARWCHSFRGIHPFLYLEEQLEDWSEDMDASMNAAIDYARSRRFVSGGDRVVTVTGWKAGPGATNTVRVVDLPADGKPVCIVNSLSRFEVGTWDD
ncbi:pyruvate kinase [Clonorchis sinensis]|uniref:Pyruvate kinase n=1 Tax=Clonorchis sinensis TaxID=79923 RepID=A0A3R7H359_CLOSI|nr:pyruvate kinase [Clonorchis sinensis]